MLSFIVISVTSSAQTHSTVNLELKDGSYRSFPINLQQIVTCHKYPDQSFPAGTIDFLNGKKCIVVDLGESIGKVAVALSNEGTDDPYASGNYYSTYEAESYPFTGGWRLPTTAELNALGRISPRRWNAEKKGIEWTFDNDGEKTALFLPAAGWYSVYNMATYEWEEEWEHPNVGISGNYWSGNIYGNSHDCLYFKSDMIEVYDIDRDSWRKFKYNLRAFHSLSSVPSYGISVFTADGNKQEYNANEVTKVTFGEDLESKYISAKSRPGTIGIVDGREAIVVELGGKKVAIATMNVGATSIDEGAGPMTDWKDESPCHGNYMAYYTAKEQADRGEWGKGWRLPTKDEAELLIKQLQSYDGSNLLINFPEKGTRLFLPETGGVVAASWHYIFDYAGGCNYWIDGGYLLKNVDILDYTDRINGIEFDPEEYGVKNIAYDQYFVRPFHDLE